jgi:broad specificity phosphatase PhoE
MIHNVPKPELSPDFTIDDIYKIREWHYKRLKDATVDERLADIQRRSAPVIAELEERKKKARKMIIAEVFSDR